MDPVTAPERHPDDLAPAPARRHVPAGLWWALALAVVVLTIAGWQALSSPPPAAAPGDDVVHLGGTGVAASLSPTSLGLRPAVDPVGSPVPTVGWETFDGGHGTFADYRGRPLVVNFWASWCVPCVSEMPGFESVHTALGDSVAFLGLNVTDNLDAARDLADRTGVTYDLGRDPTGDIVTALGGVNMPTTVLVDRDGRVVWVTSGKLEPDALEREIRERLQP